MYYDYDVVAVTDGVFNQGIHDCDVLREIYRWAGVADRGELAGVHGVAQVLQCGDQLREVGECVPCAGDEDDLGFGHCEGYSRWRGFGLI